MPLVPKQTPLEPKVMSAAKALPKGLQIAPEMIVKPGLQALLLKSSKRGV